MYTDNDFIRLDWATKYVLRDKADFEVFEGLSFTGVNTATR